MAEPAVQVPVSLIERARAVVESEVDETWVFRAQEALRALLSQPYTPAAPPRIEDMAPGTTFTEASDGWPRTAWAVGQRHNGTKYAKRQSDGWVLDPKYIDPSTIRDETPPATPRTAIVAEADVKLAAITAAYTGFESTGDLHELARAVGVILDRREDG